MLLLTNATNNTDFGTATKFKEIPRGELFPKFVLFIHKVMRCNVLSKKLKAWFNDNNGKIEKKLKFRFRGQESRAYLTHFPTLINLVFNSVGEEDKCKLLVIHRSLILLRRLISISARITDISEEELDAAELDATELSTMAVHKFSTSSPTMWCMTHVMVPHSRETYRKYKFGLGCNTMEGREQKHQKIAQYHHHSTFQQRWEKAFRHEFIQLIYLRENGFDKLTYRKRSINYVPSGNETSCKKCHANLVTANGCGLCDYELDDVDGDEVLSGAEFDSTDDELHDQGESDDELEF